MNLNVSIQGITAIQDAAKYVQKAVGDALEEITTEGALVIENEAKTLCPVLTGTLRRSIHHLTTEKDAVHARVQVGPNTPYAGFVEFGTSRMSAQPYMRPAFDIKQDEARQVMLTDARQKIIEAIQAAQPRRRR
jgi:HK97 gp10 family phage protein